MDSELTPGAGPERVVDDNTPPSQFKMSDLREGAAVLANVTVTSDELDTFMRLSKDYAAAHRDAVHAQSLGFRHPIVHGFCTSLPFSRLLGMHLPGPNSVIQSVELRFKKEVYVGDRLTYRVAVSRLSTAVGAVRLQLTIKRDDGEMILEGTAQCVFPRQT